MHAMRAPDETADHVLGRLADRAHGLVRSKDALAAGVTRGEFAVRVRRRYLIRQHRGIYRVGHAAPNIEADYLAAVWACGDEARLSGFAAAYEYRLIRGTPPTPEVSAPTKRTIEGVITHHRRRTDLGPIVVVRGIPVTTVAQVIVDIASRLSDERLAQVLHEAGVRYETKPSSIEQVLARQPNASGSRRLRMIMRDDAAATLSALERAFPRLLGAEGLDLPDEMNRPAGGHYVDCRWIEKRLTVELDGYRFHNSRHSWAKDRQREREAYARGDQFRRYTHDDVYADPRPMLAELHSLLD